MYKELFMLTVVYSGGSVREFTFSSKQDRFQAYKVAISLNEDLKFTFWESIKEVCNE